MSRTWLWLRNNWRVVAVGFVGGLGALLGGLFVKELRRPDKLVRRELDASKAGEKTAERLITSHADDVVRAINLEHVQLIKDFDDAQKAKMDRLRANPIELSKWLARLASKQRDG